MTTLTLAQEHLFTYSNIDTSLHLRRQVSEETPKDNTPITFIIEPVDTQTQTGDTGIIYPYIVSSPYTDPAHLLDLTTVSLPYQQLAQALTLLEAATPSYATTAYSTCLNWPEVFTALKTISDSSPAPSTRPLSEKTQQLRKWHRTEFYVVEFRSVLKPESQIDTALLSQLDKESHREATQSGGLLKYWFGSPDSERRNLATCLWRSKEDAIAGGKGPWHKLARGATGQMYESIDVKGLRLVVEDDISNWSFESYTS